MSVRVATDPRLRRRRRAVERMRRKRILYSATAAAALGFVVWAAFGSPLLAVRDVRVTGARHTSAAEVVRAAGLTRADNLLLLSTDDVARRAESLPWVRRAAVDRIIPGTVRIRITERKPALVLTGGALRWTIDAGGRVLVRGRAAPALPALVGAEVASLRPGMRVQGREIAHALAAWRRFPPALRRRVQAVVATSVERISLSLDGGTVVRYGAAESLAAKNDVLVKLLRRLGREGRSGAYVDVRVPASPAVGPATPR